MGNPQTDIVLPVHDAMEYTTVCLDSLFAHTENFRLILVDDYSTVEMSAYLMSILQRQPTALYIRTAQQKWFTRASNIGLRMVRTPRAVLLNSDCILDKGWLEELYGVWEEVEAMGARIGLVGSVFSGEEKRRWLQMAEPGYVTGHAVLFSMEALWQISEKRGQAGWFLDEVHQDAIHINSDKYASWEMNRMGMATIASFKSAVGHHGGKSWNYNLGRVYSLRIGDPLKGEVLG